jgi:hypothetical protein
MSCTWCCVVHPLKISELAPHLVLQLLFFKLILKVVFGQREVTEELNASVKV